MLSMASSAEEMYSRTWRHAAEELTVDGLVEPRDAEFRCSLVSAIIGAMDGTIDRPLKDEHADNETVHESTPSLSRKRRASSASGPPAAQTAQNGTKMDSSNSPAHSPAGISASYESKASPLERKPISVSKIGKMKKRAPAAAPIKEPARVSRSRSPTPPKETDHRAENVSRHHSPTVEETKAADRDKAGSPIHVREAAAEGSPMKRQKRPGARRDPVEAERERQETLRRQEESDRQAREAANLRNQYHRGSEAVRSHYNARPNQGREQRNQSPIVNLRNFNNWVKSTLIRNFTPRARDQQIRVLDMGCGKGGDLMKWDKANISFYTGIDLAEVSVDQARGRYRKMRNPRFWADFYAFDCFGLPLTQLLPPDRRTFDIVSMQFCLHYAFESEAKARQMLSNVACSLPRGGKFLGTIPSSDAIISHIEKLPEGSKEWGNGIYRVEFENQPPPGPDVVFRPPFGHRYTFYLKDAVDIVPEYVVPFNAFRALAEEYNLELLYHKGFHELFDENCDDFDGGMLLDRMGVVKKDGSRGIEGDEREACGFYSAFCFEKRGAK